MKEIQYYIHIHFILHLLFYVHRIKKNGGKQQLTKRKREILLNSSLILIEIFSPWSEFDNHLATIRLDDERFNQYPPRIIILQTAKILFKTVN
jgi:hypothetical protein